MRILFAVLAIGLGVCVGQQTTCDDVHFQSCSASMATMLGISNIGLWNDYRTLQNTFETMFTQNTGSLTGLVTVCNALQQFYLCLGQTNVQLCLGVNGLITRGLSPMQAYSFDGLLKQYQFMCGTGFYVAQYSNLQCLQRVTQQFNATLRGCVQTYQTNILHDPNQACTYSSQLMDCYKAPFNTNCSPGQDVATWWSCETQRQFIMAQFAACNLSCIQSMTAEYEEYLKSHHKIEDGVHWYKLPNVFEKSANGDIALIEGQWVTG